jgi:hypothetical protein
MLLKTYFPNSFRHFSPVCSMWLARPVRRMRVSVPQTIPKASAAALRYAAA